MSRLVYISTNYRYNKENPTNFGGDDMEYATERRLEDIAPLLERLDRGETLSEEEHAELAAIRRLDGIGWEGELPHSIRTLTALESLNLRDSQVSNLTPLSGLLALKSLDLESTHVSDLTPLSGLTALRSLDLMSAQVSDLTPLSGLTALEYLNLWNTQVSNLTPLSGLTALESLNLRYTQVSNLTPLSGMMTLKSLNLGGTQVSKLTPLSGLKNLEFLNLDNIQVNDLTPLSGMTALKSLNLFTDQLSNLSLLCGLRNLESLGLSHTQVSDLSPLSGLRTLKRLRLANTKARDLAALSGLEQLEYLDLRYCNLRAIPRYLIERFDKIYWDMNYHDKGIFLDGATISTQPISIFRESDEVIRAYYDAPKKAVRESKVIFLGDGGAGKTHTIKRILKDGKDDNIGTDATLGIAIQPYTAHKGRPDEFKINFWDFGGQENMHAMHRCFLTERTLYVVVINNRWDLDQQARYWLDNIHSFAPDSPVILAVNLWEGIHKYGLDTNRLHRDYPNLVEVQPYAAKGEDNGNFTALTNLIVEQAEKLDSCAMELPVEWAAIRQEMIDKANSDEWYLNRVLR